MLVKKLDAVHRDFPEADAYHRTFIVSEKTIAALRASSLPRTSCICEDVFYDFKNSAIIRSEETTVWPRMRRMWAPEIGPADWGIKFSVDSAGEIGGFEGTIFEEGRDWHAVEAQLQRYSEFSPAKGVDQMYPFAAYRFGRWDFTTSWGRIYIEVMPQMRNGAVQFYTFGTIAVHLRKMDVDRILEDLAPLDISATARPHSKVIECLRNTQVDLFTILVDQKGEVNRDGDQCSNSCWLDKCLLDFEDASHLIPADMSDLDCGTESDIEDDETVLDDEDDATRRRTQITEEVFREWKQYKKENRLTFDPSHLTPK